MDAEGSGGPLTKLHNFILGGHMHETQHECLDTRNEYFEERTDSALIFNGIALISCWYINTLSEMVAPWILD